MAESIIDRFWSKVEITESCWNWIAGKNSDGYGSFWTGKVDIRAHRFSWMLINGDIPKHASHHGLCVLHRCDNPACVNPDHLFIGEIALNNADRASKGRNNHASGTNHQSAKLDDIKVRVIRRYADVISQSELGRIFGVTKQSIRSVVRRETWKHV